MNRPLNVHPVPAARPSSRRPLPLLATFAPISHFPPLCFQSLAHSSALMRGWGVVAHAPEITQTMSSRAKRGICFFFTSLPHHVLTSCLPSPLESTLPAKHRVSPYFDRYRPQATSLESILTRMRLITSLDATLTKIRGRGWCTALTRESMKDLSSLVIKVAPVPLQPPPHGATMIWNRETSPLPPVSNLIERTSGAATQHAAPVESVVPSSAGRPGLPSRVGKAGSVRLGQCPFLGPR
jgi:hypothetical protein